MGYIFHQEQVKYLNSINEDNIEDITLQLFHYQYLHNKVYNSFVKALNINPETVKSITEIPFLPVSFFKSHDVVTGTIGPDTLVFKSSGTTADIPARHYVPDEELYVQSLLKGFREYYGEPEGFAILALLPSYLQREGASLVYMAQKLMEQSGHRLNGFYLDEHEQLFKVIQELENAGQPTILIGVTFALLDFAEKYPMNLKHTIVMETGGMKGRRKELTRGEVHDILKDRLGLEEVDSEYGMTEMLSQAYAAVDGRFHPARTMRVLVRDMHDPFEIKRWGAGCLNIIDLANVHSCAFIATDDMGRTDEDEYFEVLGRVDHSALRGCNLMVV